jgi:hypothetical protein
MEASADLAAASVVRLDERLQSLELPTLGGLQWAFSKKYAAVLKRARIRNRQNSTCCGTC